MEVMVIVMRCQQRSLHYGWNKISDEGQLEMLVMMLAMFFCDNVGDVVSDYDLFNR